MTAGPFTVRHCLAEGTRLLADTSATARLDAEVLLATALGVTREHLVAAGEEVVADEQRDRFFSFIERRRAQEPVAYIVGRKYFFEDSFFVDPRVLIPRPDSEVIVEEALRRLRYRTDAVILDLCCGSGCIGLSIFRFAGARLTLADLSPEALEVARMNAERILPHRVKNISFVAGDLFENITGTFDLITANPPYLTSTEVDDLTGTPGAYEPRMALDGGPDGFSVSRRILADAHRFLKPGGHLLMELGFLGAPMARTAQTELTLLDIVKDYNGVERVGVFTSGR